MAHHQEVEIFTGDGRLLGVVACEVESLPALREKMASCASLKVSMGCTHAVKVYSYVNPIDHLLSRKATNRSERRKHTRGRGGGRYGA